MTSILIDDTAHCANMYPALPGKDSAQLTAARNNVSAAIGRWLSLTPEPAPEPDISPEPAPGASWFTTEQTIGLAVACGVVVLLVGVLLCRRWSNKSDSPLQAHLNQGISDGGDEARTSW